MSFFRASFVNMKHRSSSFFLLQAINPSRPRLCRAKLYAIFLQNCTIYYFASWSIFTNKLLLLILKLVARAPSEVNCIFIEHSLRFLIKDGKELILSGWDFVFTAEKWRRRWFTSTFWHCYQLPLISHSRYDLRPLTFVKANPLLLLSFHMSIWSKFGQYFKTFTGVFNKCFFPIKALFIIWLF